MKQNEIKDISTKAFVTILLAVLAALALIIVMSRLWELPERFAVEKEYKRQFSAASEEALGYIYEKYGFEAVILDDTDTEDYNRSMLGLRYHFREGDDQMFLKMEAGGREFYAHTIKRDGSFMISDNYQYEEIKSALTDKISESLPDGVVMDIALIDTESGAFHFSFFDIYYDGGNLDEVLSRCSGRLEMVFPNVQFARSDIIDRLCQTHIDIKFTSFDTADKMEEFIETARPAIITENGRQYAIIGIDNIRVYEQYEPYITDRIVTDNGEIKTRSGK